MAIIFTVAAPIVFLVGEAPPTPPSAFHSVRWTAVGCLLSEIAFAATKKRPSLTSLAHAMLGKVPRDEYAYMTKRQRIDFVILCMLFGVLVGMCVHSLSLESLLS